MTIYDAPASGNCSPCLAKVGASLAPHECRPLRYKLPVNQSALDDSPGLSGTEKAALSKCVCVCVRVSHRYAA